jgi:hypothetical protein
LPELLKYKVLRLYTRNINDVTAQCVYLQQDKKEYPAEVRWCFDPSSGLPLETFSGNEYWHTKFAGYKPFGTKFVPGTIELFFRSESRGKAVIESIEPQVNDPEHIFKPPSDAVGRPWCDDMQGVRPSVFQPVSVPPGARSRQGLELVYELTIDEKGRVLTVIPMAEKPFVDRIAIKSMLDWEFEPAKCGDTPVMSDISIDIIHFMRQ